MHAMELGGNAPFLVLADADLGQTVAGAMVAKMRNGGEACTAANRFYVHASIAGEFGRRLASAMGALTVGPGLDAGVEVGPLVNEPARKKVGELVAGIVDASARILTGGTPPDRAGYFYLPTVLAEVPRTRPSWRRRSSGRSHQWSPSTTSTTRSGWPTTPRAAWWRTSTPATWRPA